MNRQVAAALLVLFISLFSSACGGPQEPSSTLKCGAGTVENGGFCVATPSAPVCGAGTVEQDGGCVVAPSAPGARITRARLTTLNPKYDLTKPVFLNNPLPIRFGITSSSADIAKPAMTKVVVTFSFVEANPTDPANARSCDSNGIELRLVGDNVEQMFDADIYPTTDCAVWVGAGAVANLAVDFDRGLRLSNISTGTDAPPVVFSAAAATNADNQLCHTQNIPNAPAGCVYAISLAPTPVGDAGTLVDIKLDSLRPQSSVGVVWPTQEDPEVPDGGRESDPPFLLINAVFVIDGKDPYKNQVDVSKIPPELIAEVPTIAEDLKFGLSDEELNALDDLPGSAAITYDLAPSNKISPTAWLPLTIDDPANPDPDGHVGELAISELEPGSDNTFTHALYVEGATREAIAPLGAWANDDDFTVRGCLKASFPEGGNTGEEDADEDAVGGDSGKGDCKTFKVRLVRATPPTSSATAHSFDQTWERTVGSPDRVALIGRLRTANSLDLGGARTDTEGVVEIKGKIGNDFSVQLFRAFGKGGALVTKESSFVDVGVEAFGTSVFGYQNSTADQTYSMPFMVAKAFQFPGLSFGFGPVSVGITAGVGGNVGITTELAVSAKDGNDPMTPELSAATSVGSVKATVTPSVGLTGNITGGIDLLIAKAAAVATVQIIEIGLPLIATLRWGVTGTDSNTMAVTKLTILGDLAWNLTIAWLNVNVDVVGKVGIGFFSISKTVNIFTYKNPTETVSLLTRKIETPIELQ